MSNNKADNSLFWVFIGILVLAAVAAAYYFLKPKPSLPVNTNGNGTGGMDAVDYINLNAEKQKVLNEKDKRLDIMKQTRLKVD